MRNNINDGRFINNFHLAANFLTATFGALSVLISCELYLIYNVEDVVCFAVSIYLRNNFWGFGIYT